MSDSLEVPELTADNKTNILLLQRQILSTQLELTKLREALDITIQKIARDLSVDTDKFTFDLNALRIVPKG